MLNPIGETMSSEIVTVGSRSPKIIILDITMYNKVHWKNDSNRQDYKKETSVRYDCSNVLSNLDSHLLLRIKPRTYATADIQIDVLQFVDNMLATHQTQYGDNQVRNHVERFRYAKPVLGILMITCSLKANSSDNPICTNHEINGVDDNTGDNRELHHFLLHPDNVVTKIPHHVK